jgi:hypothetical protein
MTIYRMHHLKCNPTTITYYYTKIKSEADLNSCNGLSPPSPLLKSRPPLLLGHCSCQWCKSCAGAHTVYSQAEDVFILKYYITSKSSAAVCEAFSDV